jgi:sulfotransferase
MGRVLFAWELGSGWGHIMPFKPIALRLGEHGHHVLAVLRDIARGGQAFADSSVLVSQAPFKADVVGCPIESVVSFAHILHNVGFDDAIALSQRLQQWRRIFERFKPDVIVFEHSPTALLAARGLKLSRILFCTGFFAPHDNLRALRSEAATTWDQLARDELRTLEVINDALALIGEAPLGGIAQLFHEVNETALATFVELDHLAPRGSDAHYYGAWSNAGGEAPAWPQGDGPRVFCYLKPCAALPKVLDVLKRRRVPTLICGDGLSSALIQEFRCDAITFTDSLVDLAAVGRECDLAITNANHNTVAALLLAGKPILQLPIALEQSLLADRTEALGASLAALASDGLAAARRLDELLRNLARHTEAARLFATRYADFSPQKKIENLTSRIESLVNQSCVDRASGMAARPAADHTSQSTARFSNNGKAFCEDAGRVAPPLYFVSGLPRSGSTLLMNLLGQNPRHHVTPTNALLELFFTVKERWTQFLEFQAQGLDTVKPRILKALRGLLHGYYEEELRRGKAVFDKSRGWLQYIEPVEQALGHRIQVIVTVRDVRSIVASFEKLYRARTIQHRDPVGDDYFNCQSIEGRARAILGPAATAGLAIARLRDALERGVGDRLVVVPYAALTSVPSEMMSLLHRLFNFPAFQYDPSHVEQLTQEDDSLHGMPLHRVRPEVEPEAAMPWEGVLPSNVANWISSEYADINDLAMWPRRSTSVESTQPLCQIPCKSGSSQENAIPADVAKC